MLEIGRQRQREGKVKTETGTESRVEGQRHRINKGERSKTVVENTNVLQRTLGELLTTTQRLRLGYV